MLCKFSESRLAYTSALELPKRVCESFKSGQKDWGTDLDSGLQDATNDMGSENDGKNSESVKKDGSDNFNAVLSESDSSTEPSKETQSDSDGMESGSNKESNSEIDSSSGSLYSEVNQNKITNTNNDLSNDITNSGSENNGGASNSIKEQSKSDTSSGKEEETQTKITIQNYGYESEAVLKSTACRKLFESFKILFFSTFIVKALF